MPKINPKVLDFIAAGFRIENQQPANNTYCQVITNHLNVHNGTWHNLIGFDINTVLIGNEHIIAWKYIKQRKIK